MNRNTLGAWERLLEAIRGVLPSPSWVSFFIHGGFTPFGFERMMGYKIGGGDVNGRRK